MTTCDNIERYYQSPLYPSKLTDNFIYLRNNQILSLLTWFEGKPFYNLT